jgi:hypothetical protein
MRCPIRFGWVCFGVFAVVSFVAAAVLVAAPSRQSAVTNFSQPTSVAGTLISGRVLIEHDHEKMAQGQNCTTIYRSDAGKRKGEELVSFMCTPTERPKTASLRVLCLKDSFSGTEIMKEYQFAGDTEAHGVPAVQ